MSHQVEPDTVTTAAAGFEPAPRAEQIVFVPQTPGSPVIHPEHFGGRRVSWVAVTTIMLGFLCGGLALVIGPTWWAFWLGVAVAVVGLLMSFAINLFDDWY
jgi:hypothetical protein